MIKLKQASPDQPFPLGVGLIGLALAGSLWASIGFISEWAAIEAGLPEEVAHLLFRSIAFGTVGLTCAVSSWSLYRFPSWRRQAMLGLCLYLLLLWMTPRSFTYDTGLYHLPLINHLNQIGLEWNLGWLHSRYAFFNLLLFGQAAMARLIGTVGLPSINGITLTGLLLLFLNIVKGNWHFLAACLVTSGVLLVPSESTESFHSYNADFSLGCVFLACCLLVTSQSSKKECTPHILAIAAFIPAIKISGLILLPAIVYGLAERWGLANISFYAKKIVPLLAAIAITTGSIGYITSGYLSYPVAASGPLRDQSISKKSTIDESKKWTIGWARFAYSGQLDQLKPDARPHDWMPKWAKSSNGKRMLGYSVLSTITTLGSFRLSRLKIWKPILVSTTILWVLAIVALPPDPRFYLGLALVNIYCGSVWLVHPDILGIRNSREAVKALLASIMIIIVAVSFWRTSEHEFGKFPKSRGIGMLEGSVGRYKPRGERKIIVGADGTCWDLPAPCKP